MPLFISVEGLEGASKSTSIATIASVFKEHNEPLALTREPGGTPLADELRSSIKREWDEVVDSNTEVLLMFASRHQSYINVIFPMLDEGENVLSDRCWWSSFAYQAYKRDVDENLFRQLKESFVDRRPFDAVLFLDVTPEVGIVRAKGRGELDRFEKKEIEFFKRAQKGYRHLALTEKNVTTVNADGGFDEIQTQVRAWAESLIVRIKAEREQ